MTHIELTSSEGWAPGDAVPGCEDPSVVEEGAAAVARLEAAILVGRKHRLKESSKVREGMR